MLHKYLFIVSVLYRSIVHNCMLQISLVFKIELGSVRAVVDYISVLCRSIAYNCMLQIYLVFKIELGSVRAVVDYISVLCRSITFKIELGSVRAVVDDTFYIHVFVTEEYCRHLINL